MADLDSRPPELRGLVLAGGLSERFGRDKAGALIEGQTLLERAVETLGAVVSDVRVAVRQDQMNESLRGRFVLLADVAEGIGPAAGILAAHSAYPETAWLVVACDMPLVTPELLAVLIENRDPARPATAFRAPTDGLPEPLCAIYEPATLARFRHQVEAGGNPSPRSWLVAQHPMLLDAPSANALSSVNTPGDLDQLSRP